MHIPKEFKEFIESLNEAKVEYLVIGAHALALHGVPRYTGDLDILVRRSTENAARIVDAIRVFGLESLGFNEADFLEPDQFIQIGVAPLRLDICTDISGVTFEEAWANRVTGEIGGVPVAFIGKDEFIKNKRAVGRPKDLGDIDQIL